MRKLTTDRNREIFAAHQAGELPRTLAEKYGLAVSSLEHVLRDEKHKLAVSVDEFYRKRRQQVCLQPLVRP